MIVIAEYCYTVKLGLIAMPSCQQTITNQENIQARSVGEGDNVAVSYKLAQGYTLGPFTLLRSGAFHTINIRT